MDECKDAVSAALGREPTDRELEDIASAVQERMRRKLGEGMSKRDAAAAVERDMSEEAKRAKAIKTADAYNNILIFADLNARTIKGEAALSERSVLAGRTKGAGRGFADSVDANHRSSLRQLESTTVAGLRKDGVLAAAKSTDKKLNRDVAVEIRRLADPTLEADSGNAVAKKIAVHLGGMLENSRAMLNAAGAFVGKIEGYMGRQYHDMLKVRGKGAEGDFASWRDVAMKEFDLNKMYPDVPPQDIEGRLKDVWGALATGRFQSATDGALAGFEGGRNIGRKVSQGRTIEFNDADSWVRYNEKFGKGNVMDAIWAGADGAARDAAIMQKFGTNPEAMFKKWHEHNLANAAISEVDSLKGNPNQGLADMMFGKNTHPASQTVATIGATIRNVMQLKNLGAVVFSTVSDIPMMASTLRHNGVPFWQGMAEIIHGLLPQGPRAREISDLLGVGFDGWTGAIVHRFRAEDGVPGHMAQAVNTFYKLNGLAWETDAVKAGAGRIITKSLADHSGMEFGQLDQLMQNTLRRYGIEAKEWDIARAATKTINEDTGRSYLLPMSIEDKAVSRKMWNLVSDQINEGINEPSAASKYFTTGRNTQSGTVWGEAVRSFMQFKSFGYTFLQRHGGRTFGRDGVDYPGAIYLLGGMTLAGAVTNAIGDVTRNKTPALPTDGESLAKWSANALQRGGSLGFYGDMLFSQGGTGPGDFAKQMFGPAFQPVFDVGSALATFRAGSNKRERAQIAASEGTQFLKKNMPNIPFVKAATDYIILHYLQEAITPGSVAKYERTVRKNNQSFILPLSR